MANNYQICDKDLYERIKPYIKYHYKQMVVFTNKHHEYIVWNTKKEFKTKDKEYGHGHLKSLKMAKTVCINIADKRIPKQRSHYILICHTRCSTDKSYIGRIEKLLEVRRHKGKTLPYKNKSCLI